MNPETALAGAVLGSMALIVFALLHKWQARDFTRGYALALDHVADEIRCLRFSGRMTEQKEARDVRVAILDVVIKLRRENGDG